MPINKNSTARSQFGYIIQSEVLPNLEMHITLYYKKKNNSKLQKSLKVHNYSILTRNIVEKLNDSKEIDGRRFSLNILFVARISIY